MGNKHAQVASKSKKAVMIKNVFLFCKVYFIRKIRRSSCIRNKGIRHIKINFATVTGEQRDLVNAWGNKNKKSSMTNKLARKNDSFNKNQ
jgi:hypothetical protein